MSRLQPIKARAEAGADLDDLGEQPRQVVVDGPLERIASQFATLVVAHLVGIFDGLRQQQARGPYLTSREALVYLRLDSLSALYTHIRENKLPTCRCGGNLRFDTRELDAWLRGTDALSLRRTETARRRAGNVRA